MNLSAWVNSPAYWVSLGAAGIAVLVFGAMLLWLARSERKAAPGGPYVVCWWHANGRCYWLTKRYNSGYAFSGDLKFAVTFPTYDIAFAALESQLAGKVGNLTVEQLWLMR